MQAKAISKPMRWPATLIALVNEAQEASRSFQLVDAFRVYLPPRDNRPVPPASASGATPTTCMPPPAQGALPLDPPGIISVSSTADVATRVAYPAAQTLRVPFNSLRSYDASEPNFLGVKNQKSMFLNPTAHMQVFQSHLVSACRCVGQRDAVGYCIDPKDLRCDDENVEKAINLCAIRTQSLLASSEYVLIERPDAKNLTPYWAFQMPPSIVPDHSTIFTPVFRNFLITFLETTRLTYEIRSRLAAQE
jgi:hypothetical protein